MTPLLWLLLLRLLSPSRKRISVGIVRRSPAVRTDATTLSKSPQLLLSYALRHLDVVVLLRPAFLFQLLLLGPSPGPIPTWRPSTILQSPAKGRSTIRRSVTTTTAVRPQTAHLDLGGDRHGCGALAGFQTGSHILVLWLLWRLLLWRLRLWVWLLGQLRLWGWRGHRGLSIDFRRTGSGHRRKSRLVLHFVLALRLR